jgi:outer membrane protein assembly factor BamD (BamD/ComL family)
MRRGLAVLALLAGCATVSQQDALNALALAEQQLEQGEPQAAVDLLSAVDQAAYTGRELERYELRLATALSATGRDWQAFKVIRSFTDDHPFSELRADIEYLQFRIGERLINSNGGFLFFSSDKEDGRVVLEHLVQRAMLRRDVLADALRLLGEKAYVEGDWELARQRYTQLRRDHEDSEWVPLALFRMAMCRFATLEGAAYDLEEMELTRRELAHLAEGRLENPQMRAQIGAALRQVTEWIGERHLMIAGFYRRIGNQDGEARHLRLAARDYGGTPAGERARAGLQRLGKPLAETGQ